MASALTVREYVQALTLEGHPHAAGLSDAIDYCDDVYAVADEFGDLARGALAALASGGGR